MEKIGLKADFFWGEMQGTLADAAIWWNPKDPKDLLVTHTWDDESSLEDFRLILKGVVDKGQPGFFRRMFAKDKRDQTYTRDQVIAIAIEARTRQIELYTKTARAFETLQPHAVRGRNAKVDLPT